MLGVIINILDLNSLWYSVLNKTCGFDIMDLFSQNLLKLCQKVSNKALKTYLLYLNSVMSLAIAE